MNFEVVVNLLTLFAAIIGMLLSLFKYIEAPKRGWMYICVFFLTHILSDYYWTTYTLVMGENPNVSAFMAYFGWNVGYLFLLLAVIHMRPKETRRFIHPLMFIPIPLNIWQFTIYIQYGGILNNIWEGVIVTAIACFCLQVLLYYVYHRKDGMHLPCMHLVVLGFVIVEYGMWTSSCFDWPSEALDPYYYFAILEGVALIATSWSVGREYEDNGIVAPEKNAQEMRFQFTLQIIVFALIFIGCAGGYYTAKLMKNAIPEGMEDEAALSNIAITLFVISIILVVLILMVIFLTAARFKRLEIRTPGAAERKRGRFNFIFTVVITLCLMIASVVYTSRLFYKVSVTGVIEDGETRAASVAADFENYLGVARSVLGVTADTVNIMLEKGATQEDVRQFITKQTENQFREFDENFTGIYGYINGEYMDGSGWVPPEGYKVESRDWFKAAVEADGETIIVSPYVDAQTGSVVITICKLLDNKGWDDRFEKRQVVALDMVVNHVQDVTEQINIDGKGFAMVLNFDGMVIAHRDTSLNGQNTADIYGKEFMESILGDESGHLEVKINGVDATLFTDSIMGQWYVVIAISDDQLFSEVYHQLLVNIVVSLVLFLLISFFYYLGYKNEQLNGRKMEELRSAGLKQEYESKVLKLEKDSADEANKAKSRFLADMSHEIRTPINAILGMNEMVLRESEDSDILEYSRNIRTSGKNLLQLINSILDFSKIEDGKMEIVPASYATASMVNYLMNSIRERANSKNLDLIFNIDSTLPKEMYGDDSRIDQVIMNLLTNAVKYTQKGTVTLIIEGKQRSGGHILLHVEVRDTGIGIKEEDMGKLFESFERLDKQKNRNIEGTGLGMSITTSLLKLMDSQLKVESVYGTGSVFSFDLWQGIVNEEPLGDYTQYQEEEEDPIGTGSSLYAPSVNVLVVDDTRMNLVVAANLLKRTGMDVDTAMSGEEALTLARIKKYDIILLDQRMPGMDGTETLEKLRKLPKNTDTPVICLTADAIRGTRERLMAEGFTDYLSKPVDGHTLEKMMVAYLPKEKIKKQSSVKKQKKPEEPVKEVKVQEEKKGENPLFAKLRAVGVKTDVGLKFCVDDEEVYLDVLETYAKEAGSRRKMLIDDLAAEDFKDYGIGAHSLKSTSRTIGAQALADVAEKLEYAANEEDAETIDTYHDTAIEMYDKIAAIIDEEMGDGDKKEEQDDGEIFEFTAR